MYKYSSEHSILNENASIDLTYSLADIYDSISLYEYEEEKVQNEKKAISWEEWYLNKKLLSLKAQKKLKQKNETLSNENNQRTKKNYTEEEKKAILTEWLKKKRKQKENHELNLKKNLLKKEKEEKPNDLDKKKAEEKYQNWLEELKNRERLEKLKKQEELQQAQLERERELEKRRRMYEEKKELEKKAMLNVRPITEKKGTAYVNGKLHSFFDWSTSPDPSYINKNDFKF